MKKGAWILSSAAAISIAWVACENVKQPKSLCAIGQGPYAVKYTPKGDAGQPMGNCALKKGELIGVRDYGDKRTTYFIAIGTQTLGSPASLGYPDSPSNHLYSFGPYPFDPGPDDFCEAGPLDRAVGEFPATRSSNGTPLPPIPAKSYQWSRVRFLNVPQAAGNQMTADLIYTDAADGGCVGYYDVVGVWPGVSCALPDGGSEPTLCATRDAPDGAYSVGCNNPANRTLCFSSDQKVKCDPEIRLCVLDGTPPVFAPR